MQLTVINTCLYIIYVYNNITTLIIRIHFPSIFILCVGMCICLCVLLILFWEFMYTKTHFEINNRPLITALQNNYFRFRLFIALFIDDYTTITLVRSDEKQILLIYMNFMINIILIQIITLYILRISTTLSCFYLSKTAPITE